MRTLLAEPRWESGGDGLLKLAETGAEQTRFLREGRTRGDEEFGQRDELRRQQSYV